MGKGGGREGLTGEGCEEDVCMRVQEGGGGGCWLWFDWVNVQQQRVNIAHAAFHVAPP